MANNFCPNCGGRILPGQTHCPNCGASLQQTPPSNGIPQPPGGNGYPPYTPYNLKPQNNGRGNNNLVIILLSVLIAVVLIGVVVFFVVSNNEKKEAEKQRQEQVAAQKDKEIAQLKNTTDSLKAESQKKPATQTKVVVVKQRGVPASQATQCVITGTGVRMRLGPGKQYNYPVNRSGHAYTVPKGTALPFLGESGNWNNVLFEGGSYWVSKDFSYLR